jgi:hypothetical protein
LKKYIRIAKIIFQLFQKYLYIIFYYYYFKHYIYIDIINFYNKIKGKNTIYCKRLEKIKIIIQSYLLFPYHFNQVVYGNNNCYYPKHYSCCYAIPISLSF